MIRICVFALTMVLAAAAAASPASAQFRSWDEIVAAARGQSVYWNAWAGDERTNAFIAWVGEEAKQRYGIAVEQV